MHADLANIGWTEEHWNRIGSTVTEEAQKARVAAQMLPISGPEDGSAVAVPNFTLLGNDPDPTRLPPATRLTVNSEPRLPLTTIAVNVQLRTHEASDPQLTAALVMFRRAANHIARIEDALAFYGRPVGGPPPFGLGGIPNVFTVTGDGQTDGILSLPRNGREYVVVNPAAGGGPGGTANPGQALVIAVAQAIDRLEANGQSGPYACVLGHGLFEDACNPTANLVLPRDRILPFLQGPLLRASAVTFNWGAIVALSGNPVELVVAKDIDVRYLQSTLEPRYVFRVCERVALRIKETNAIALLER